MKNEKLADMQKHHFQAITTKYICPTNTKGSRVKATCFAGSATISWDDGLNVEENHYLAAEALKTKKNWKGQLIFGDTPDGKGFCFVFLPDEYSKAVDAVIETRNAMRRGENGGNPHCRKFGQMVCALTDKDDYAPFLARYESQIEEQ